MRILMTLLTLVSLTTFAATKKPASKSALDKIEMVWQAGDVTDVKVTEVLEKNLIGTVIDGKEVPGGKKLYQTERDTIPFYAVSVTLRPSAGKELERVTAANVGKTLSVRADGKVVYEAKIRAAIPEGRLVVEPPRPEYDPKSDGTKESSESKLVADKLAAELEQKLVKAK